jgi:glycosyltransferase involved in cell wall biosynthesis
MPLVSVIIPAYNAEATIRETIESVRQQTLSDLEIIVVDDGSTDGTLRQVQTVRDDRLRAYACIHQGLSATRNRGLEHARGQFISFIDADDLWTPDKLQSQLDALQSNESAGVAYSWTVFIEQDGGFLFAKEPMYFEGNVYPQLLRSCFIASGSNVLLRRSCVDSVGLFDTSLRSAEDWEYWLRAATSWRFVVVPRYQILYRVSARSMSSDVETIERANEMVLDRALKTSPLELQNLRNECLANLKQYVGFLYLTRAVGPHYKKTAGRKLIDSIRLYPRILFRGKTQTLLWTWILLRITSPSWSTRIVRALLRVHGRLRMLLRPELRVTYITSRL